MEAAKSTVEKSLCWAGPPGIRGINLTTNEGAQRNVKGVEAEIEMQKAR